MNDESANRSISEQLTRLYADCKQAKMQVFVFHSGKHDLVDSTAGLLRHNVEKAAQEEVCKDREQAKKRCD